MNVREVAAAASGNEDFLADAIGTLEYAYTASAFAGFGRAEEPRGASAKNKSIKVARQS